MNLIRTKIRNLVSRSARRLTLALVALLLGLPGISHAAAIDAYFGYNFVGSAAAEMDLLSITYTYQGNGPPLSFTAVMPDLDGAGPGAGMLDGRGATAGPLYSTGGDGATTRELGQTLSINWSDFTGVPFPQIYINSFTYTNGPGGTPITGTFGPLETGYLLGLIDDGVGTELDAGVAAVAPRSDIYLATVNGLSGSNLQGAFTSSNPGEDGVIIFSASTTPGPVVPIPAAAWLFGSALGLLGWVRARSSA